MIKNIWRRINHWQKGGLIGFLLGLAIFSLSSLVYNNSFAYYLIIFPAVFFGNASIIMWYTALGLIFGAVLAYVSKKVKKGKNWIAVSFLILLILVIILEVVILYFKGAGKA